ncbi:hypothetical protein SFUMM280S_05313 [Streptomyces fumanus]
MAGGEPPVDVRTLAAGEALDRHRDASEAAAAAAQAARTPRIAPATAYALGVLHADQRHEVEAARGTRSSTAGARKRSVRRRQAVSGRRAVWERGNGGHFRRIR